ncbi:MAG: hypothetical protein QM496_12875 [Verrucomicrobiota bacterium]
MKTLIFTSPILFASRCAVFCSILFAYYCQAAQTQNSYHVFTDKKGKSIEATPVSISPDKTKLQIQRKDGNQFEISIMTLNLDDQQFIKSWLKENPNTINYNVNITVDKSFERSKYTPGPKGRYDIKFIVEKTQFEIEVKNLTRAKLTDLILEYYIITEHSIFARSYQDPDQKKPAEWYYPFDHWARQAGDPTPDKPISLTHGKIKLEDLPYSFSTRITTPLVDIREITREASRESLNKDTLYGIIVRLTDTEGHEISLYRSSDRPFLKKSWDEIAKMPAGNPSGEAGSKAKRKPPRN